MCQEHTYNLNARVNGEHFEVEFEGKEAAVEMKRVLKEAGHSAGVYVPNWCSEH